MEPEFTEKKASTSFLNSQFSAKSLLASLFGILLLSSLLALASPDLNLLVARLTGQYNKDQRVSTIGTPVVDDPQLCPAINTDRENCFGVVVAFQNDSQKEEFAFYPYRVEIKDNKGQAYKSAGNTLCPGSLIDPLGYQGASCTVFHFSLPKTVSPVELDYYPYSKSVGNRKISLLPEIK